MCGIIAIASLGNAALPGDSRHKLDAALEVMKRRGPDANGGWSAPMGNLLLGHTRLSLVGQRHSQQPVSNEDGSVVAVINGEIYRHQQIRRQLQQRGHKLRGDGDSELLVHLYEDHGLELMQQLRGEFAFVLYDQKRQRLLAARDRYGVKPLLFSKQHNIVMFASQAAALFAADVPRALAREAIGAALRLHYPPIGQTIYQDIEVLRPGHAITLQQGRLHQWRWASRGNPSVASIPREPQQGFRERFDEAVALRADHNGPLAVQLSGGIDSAAVLASAQRALRSRNATPQAFSVSFPGSREDERHHAEATARYLDAPLHIVEATPKRLADAWPDALEAAGGLAVNAHLPAKWLLAQAIAQAGIRVVLTGEGADEVLYGYPHLRIDAGVEHAPQLTAVHPGSVGLMLPAGERLALNKGAAGLASLPTFVLAKACIGAQTKAWLTKPFLASISADALAVQLAAIQPDLDSSAAQVMVASQLWRELALEGYILRTLGDALEMDHSLEGRVPFLDARLACWLDEQPWHSLIQPGLEKTLLREAMRERLPAALLARRKHPFVAPPLEGALIDCAADAIDSQAFRSLGIIKTDIVLKALTGLPRNSSAERKRLDPALWLVASLAILTQQQSLTLSSVGSPRSLGLTH